MRLIMVTSQEKDLKQYMDSFKSSGYSSAKRLLMIDIRRYSCVETSPYLYFSKNQYRIFSIQNIKCIVFHKKSPIFNSISRLIGIQISS